MFFQNNLINIRKFHLSYVIKLHYNMERFIRWVLIYDRALNKLTQVKTNWLHLDIDNCLYSIVVVRSLRKGKVVSSILIGGISPYPHTSTFVGRRIIPNKIQG